MNIKSIKTKWTSSTEHANQSGSDFLGPHSKMHSAQTTERTSLLSAYRPPSRSSSCFGMSSVCQGDHRAEDFLLSPAARLYINTMHLQHNTAIVHWTQSKSVDMGRVKLSELYCHTFYTHFSLIFLTKQHPTDKAGSASPLRNWELTALLNWNHFAGTGI